MAIKIHNRSFQDNFILEISGKVTSQDSLQISKKVEGLAKKKIARVIIDLSTVQYIDSQWIGVFVYTWKVLRDNKKEMVFLIPPGFIRNLFTASNLGRVFKIIGSLEELSGATAPGSSEVIPSPSNTGTNNPEPPADQGDVLRRADGRGL
jgi:anti-anti-sigma factor